MYHQAAGVADIGEMREHLQAVDKLLARFVAALDAEREDRSGALRHVFLRQVVIRAGRQRRILHPCDRLVSLEEFRRCHRVLDMTFHTHAERLNSLEEQKRVERAHAGAEIAQALHTRTDDERDGAKRLPKVHAMVRP